MDSAGSAIGIVILIAIIIWITIVSILVLVAIPVLLIAILNSASIKKKCRAVWDCQDQDRKSRIISCIEKRSDI